MSEMVHLAIADDVTEAEEIEAVLAEANIACELQPVEEADTVAVLVPESKLDDAADILAAMTDDDAAD